MELMHIPNWLDETLDNEFENIVEAVESDFETTGNIEEIEYKSRDGFFPFTNGGIMFTAPIRLEDVSSASYVFENKEVETEIERAITSGYSVARECFIENNRTRLEGLYTKEQLDNNSDDINYHDLYEKKHSKLAEELSEGEMECNSEMFFVEHRVMFFSADNRRNLTGQDEIYFMSAVNTDYDYGRDKGLIETYTQNIAVNDLTPNIVKLIVEKMLASI